MSDDKTKKKVDANFVSCTEDYEEAYTVAKIVEANKVTAAKARDAFKHCCNKVKGNQPRKEFMACAQKYLETKA
ncbi:MAG: hypothetical protein HY916_05150 [Desulfovibrio sp.]|jgi:predicted ATP-grasp superfamily ATP-dependent carboligase|nr:hypothetical protein [Desulfovibrio sp.]